MGMKGYLHVFLRVSAASKIVKRQWCVTRILGNYVAALWLSSLPPHRCSYSESASSGTGLQWIQIHQRRYPLCLPTLQGIHMPDYLS